MKLLKNHHFCLLETKHLWKPARSVFRFPESPRPESEAFKEVGLDYTDFEGKAIIGEKGKYIPENTPTINHAVRDMVIQSEVAIRKTDPERAREIKKQRSAYIAVITNSILRVTSSLVHKGDTLQMEGSNVTVTHKEKDGTERKYTVDVTPASQDIVSQALKTATIKRDRQSLEMIHGEINRDALSDPKIRQGLLYIRIFKSGSIQSIMESLGLPESGKSANHAFRTRYWEETMRKTEPYEGSPQQNRAMKEYLKKAVYEELGMTETDIKNAVEAEITLDLNTLKEKLEEQYGFQGENLPATRDDLEKLESVQNTREFITKTGLVDADIAQSVEDALDEGLDIVFEQYKIPELEDKLKTYHKYTDPITTNAQVLLDQIDRLISKDNERMLSSLFKQVDKIADTQFIRICQEYVNAAQPAIEAVTNWEQTADAYRLLPAVEVAGEAIEELAADRARDGASSKFRDQLDSFIDATRARNIGTYLNSPTFNTILQRDVKDKTKSVADYEMGAYPDIAAVMQAITSLSNQGTLLTTLNGLIQKKLDNIMTSATTP